MKKKISIYAACIILAVILGVSGPALAEFRVDELAESVVRLLCLIGDESCTGSGFAIGTVTPVQYIVTNWHVIEEGPDDVFVFYSEDMMYRAELVSVLKDEDLAILKLDESLLIEPLVLAPSEMVKVGQKVYALGFPAAADDINDEITGLKEDVTVTDGIISRIGTSNGVKIYQTNVDINPGNSGGPLVDENGQVLGINTFGVSGAHGINGAIQADELITELDRLGIGYKLAGREMNSLVSASTSETPAALDDMPTVDRQSVLMENMFLITLFMIAALIIFLIIMLIYRIIARNKAPQTSQSEEVFIPVKEDYRAVLVGVAGYFAGNEIQLNSGEEISLGRDPRVCQLVFPQETADVSRRHCTLRYDGGSHTFILIDNNSSNGTFIKGEKLNPNQPYFLRSGGDFYLSDESKLFEVRLERVG